jgi:hypothetical protein
MERWHFDRRRLKEPEISDTTRACFVNARRIYFQDKKRLSPWVVSRDPNAVEPMFEIGNYGAEDDLLKDLSRLSVSLSDAIQDLLAVINEVDLTGASRARMKSVYAHWDYVHQIENAMVVFIGALIARDQAQREKRKETE